MSFFQTLFTSKKKLSTDGKIVKRTTWSFVVFFMMAFLMGAGWHYLRHEPKEAGLPKTLRTALKTNGKVFSGLISNKHLAKTFPRDRAAKNARLNGMVGLHSQLKREKWRLRVIKLDGDTLHITLNDLKRLPETSYVFNFKCIEGWSQISDWGGVKFSVFAEHYHLEAELGKKYVGFYTPDSAYYVGLDMASALHPQTLLCYELNGKPLSLKHGYPLRLLIPIKYGVKSLKRIGTIYFSDTPPPDYWAQRGYDYFIGL